MKIGLTYDLRDDYLAAGLSGEETAEFDSIVTIQAISNALNVLGHEVFLIGNIKNLISLVASGDRWDLVFNIAEGLNGLSREAQVPTVLDIYSIPYTFSDPLTLSLCLHKGMAKRILRDLKIPTAEFQIIETPVDIKDITIPFPVFVKPVAEGTGKGIHAGSVIKDQVKLESECINLLTKYKQPVLVEEYLPGSEFTVGITGTGSSARVLGILEIIYKDNAEKNCYSYINKEECEERIIYQLADPYDAQMISYYTLNAWKGLGCRDAGRIDFRRNKDGIPYLMELNPLAGLHPTHSDLPMLAGFKGISYISLIEKIVSSALSRYSTSDTLVNDKVAL